MVSTTKEIDGKKINYKIEKLSDALVVNMLKREGNALLFHLIFQLSFIIKT